MEEWLIHVPSSLPSNLQTQLDQISQWKHPFYFNRLTFSQLSTPMRSLLKMRILERQEQLVALEEQERNWQEEFQAKDLNQEAEASPSSLASPSIADLISSDIHHSHSIKNNVGEYESDNHENETQAEDVQGKKDHEYNDDLAGDNKYQIQYQEDNRVHNGGQDQALLNLQRQERLLGLEQELNLAQSLLEECEKKKHAIFLKLKHVQLQEEERRQQQWMTTNTIRTNTQTSGTPPPIISTNTSSQSNITKTIESTHLENTPTHTTTPIGTSLTGPPSTNKINTTPVAYHPSPYSQQTGVLRTFIDRGPQSNSHGPPLPSPHLNKYNSSSSSYYYHQQPSSHTHQPRLSLNSRSPPFQSTKSAFSAPHNYNSSHTTPTYKKRNYSPMNESTTNSRERTIHSNTHSMAQSHYTRSGPSPSHTRIGKSNMIRQI